MLLCCVVLRSIVIFHKLCFCMLQYDRMSNDVQFQSVAEVDNFVESTNSSLNYLILEALGEVMELLLFIIIINVDV